MRGCLARPSHQPHSPGTRDGAGIIDRFLAAFGLGLELALPTWLSYARTADTLPGARLGRKRPTLVECVQVMLGVVARSGAGEPARSMPAL